MGENTFYGEILRIYRSCSCRATFVMRARQLMEYFLRIGYPKLILIRVLVKLMNKNPAIPRKHNSSSPELLDAITRYIASKIWS